MWHDIRTVFLMEYRRHLRARKFWQALLLSAGISLALALGYAWLFTAFEPTFSASIIIRLQTLFVLGVLSFLTATVATQAVPRIFGDLYKTRELHDLYLTRLHPVAIVVGRMLTLTVQVGLIQLVLLPAGIVVCQLAGFSPSYWLKVSLLNWCALFAIVGYGVLIIGKRFPADTAGALAGNLTQLSSFPLLLFIATIAVVVWDIFMSASGLRTGSFTHMPLVFALPPLVPLATSVPQPSSVIPVELVGVLMLFGVSGLTVVASAQRLGWWSDAVYRGQRIIGTGVFLLLYGVNLAFYAYPSVNSALKAQQTVFWGMIAAWLGYALLFAPLLGYYGVGARPRTLRYGLPPPLGGVVWEWGLGVGILLTGWLTVGIVSGYWVDPLRVLVWGLYLMSLLLLAQAVSAPMLVYCWLWLRQSSESQQLVNSAEMRAFIESRGAKIVATLLYGIFILWWLVWMIGIILQVLGRILPGLAQPFKTLSAFLSLVNPGNALTSSRHDGMYYLYYALYALCLAIVFVIGAFVHVGGIRITRIKSER